MPYMPFSAQKHAAEQLGEISQEKDFASQLRAVSQEKLKLHQRLEINSQRALPGLSTQSSDVALRETEASDHHYPTSLHWPGIEPGSTAWQAAMLSTIPPMHHVQQKLV